MNEVLKDKSGKILNFKIPRYEKLKYTLSNEETETGRIIQYRGSYYKEYVKKYDIDISGTSNINTKHNLSDFLLTKIDATEYNPVTKSQFPLPALRPTFTANEMGLYVSNTEIVIEVANNAPDRPGQEAMVALYYIKLNEPIN